jgi:hypothetical protein
MITKRVTVALALPMAVVFGLSGCSLLTTRGESVALTGVAACALGHTWTLDTTDLAPQIVASLLKKSVAGATVKVDGTQTMDWATTGEISVTSNYTTTVTVAPAPTTNTIAPHTHKGTATGKAYVNAEVGIPRNWDNSAFTLTTAFTLNGAAIPDPAPFTLPKTDFDDTVGLELTCDANTLTTHPRGSDITQKWTRS